MVEFLAFRLGRVLALVLGVAAIAALASPASARPMHRHHGYSADHGDYSSHRGYHRHQRYSKRSRGWRNANAAVAPGFGDQQQFGFQAYQQPQGFASATSYADPSATAAPRMIKQRAQRRTARQAPEAQQAQWQNWNGGGGGQSGLVAEARRYIGGNPTGRSRLWCARFMNMVLERSGHRGTGSDMASSFARYGQRLSGPQVGAIAVMSRGKRGGHVGIVSGIDPNGNPIVVSGNHNRRVAESVYSKSRIYAYVMPSS
ncbi:MAG: TIGR02594 family protein [Rhodopseudomonas palustris]|uniref:TIGR02594 family protein n=1 Tax=Rhodopseudomonas palustris TaxID=1076 RepID=A0A933RZQ1_RHOPL|nr:TIGR02594 family protein [Rhodopseudomonas palustris]